MSNLSVKRISGALGAEISGLNLNKELTASELKFIKKAFLDHQVIFLRNQDIEAQQFLNFAQAMGKPIEYPFVKGLHDFPMIIEVKKLKNEKVNFGGIWHSDTTYLKTPPMGSMLLSKEIPPYGGDTMFANQYLAYDSLSKTMQQLLQGLTGISSSAKADVTKTREDRIKTDGSVEASKVLLAEHPIVRTHPETRKKSLYINIAHTVGIKGMRQEESEPLLNFLFNHQIKPEFTCRFSWTRHAIAFWDNRCVLHNPINDYHGFKRLMLRITLQGEKPSSEISHKS